MNPLLKRQIRKYLPKELRESEDLDAFLDAINKSYKTSEEQFVMLQRATTISSEELFNVNSKLKEETNSQKKVINKLEGVIDQLQSYNLLGDRPEETTDSLTLVDFIDNQTKEIIRINNQKDALLKDLELQNQELNDYAQMVSHDLKSPLQSIETMATWLQEDYKEALEPYGIENLKIIRENVLKMDNLVRGILEYSTIRRMEGEFYKVNLNEILKKRFNVAKTSNLYFWRDHHGKEIDCIIEKANSLIPIEIKSSSTYQKEHFKNMNYWNKLAKNLKENSYLVYAGNEDDTLPYGNLTSWKNLDKIDLG